MTHLKFRSPLKTDLPAIKNINDEVQGFPWSEKALNEELEQDARFSEVVLVGATEELGGYIFIRKSGEDYELMSVAVGRQWQGNGIGRELIKRVLAKIVKPGVIHLEVGEKNHIAIGLYRSLGFEPGRLRRAYYPDGSGALEMHLKVT